MQANFEVKYLDVSWYDKETVLKVVESFLPLNVDFIPESQSFTCDAFLYPEAPEIKHGQLAFRFLAKSNIEPYFELTNGSRVSLKRLLTPIVVKFGGLKRIIGLLKIKAGKENHIALRDK